MRITQAAAGRIAETAASAVQAVSTRSTNELSPTAVTGARPEIKSEVTEALVAASGTGDGGVALVEVRPAIQSKINIGGAVAGLALLANFLKFFGIEVDAETQAAVASVIGGAFIVYAWVMRTWFSSTVTESSVKS